VFHSRVNSDYPKVLAIYPDEKHYLTLNNFSNDIFSYTINYDEHFSLEKGKPVQIYKPNCIYIMKL
jgi:6-phosphogluconolactonase